MIIDIQIDGTSFLPYLKVGSLNLPDVINERSILTFTLTNLPISTFDIVAGLPIRLKELDEVTDYGLITRSVVKTGDNGLITDAVTSTADYGLITDAASVITASLFNGTLDSLSRVFLNPVQRDLLAYGVSAVDYHKIFDRRLVAETYESETVYDIIQDLFTKYIDDEDITLGNIEGSSINVVEAAFSYESLTKVFDKLASRTGYIWYIDADKVLNFEARTTENAPWGLAETDAISNLIVYDHREQYRNKQVVKDGRAETGLQVETIVADGEQSAFVVAYPISQEPTITINGGAALDVGIRGVDTGKDFYWNKGTNEVNAEVVPSIGDEVEVSYIGEFDVVVQVDDPLEVTDRATIEGGTGLYEAAESSKGLSTLDALSDIANDRIRAFGTMGKKVNFTTMITGLQSGQLLPVNLPNLGIDNTDMLITSVSLQELATPNEFTYSVLAVTGEAVGGWTRFFADWLNPDEALNLINQNQIVTIVVNFTKTWTELESPNPFYTLYPSVTLFPSISLLPMIHPGQEIRYLQWYLSSVADGRKFRTQQSISSTEIETIVLLSTGDAVGDITSLDWAGDVEASLTLNTGINIASSAYVKTKTGFEMIQVTRTDTKGW